MPCLIELLYIVIRQQNAQRYCKSALLPDVFKNRALSAATSRVACLLRLNGSPVTPQRIAASNWLLKLKIANHIHYLTSGCVILVINKAWYTRCLPVVSRRRNSAGWEGAGRAEGKTQSELFSWNTIHQEEEIKQLKCVARRFLTWIKKNNIWAPGPTSAIIRWDLSNMKCAFLFACLGSCLPLPCEMFLPCYT